ncbi:high nitrogen upregulated cytochrome P450 monooxygenase 2, partial [Mycena latifolia]
MTAQILIQDETSSRIYLALAALLGLVNHLYFNRFEPQSASIPLLLLTIQPPLLLLALAVPLSWVHIFATYAFFILTLCSSIGVYRISPWHPLAEFPGPLVNKVTKLWGIRTTLNGNQHRVTNLRLHDIYGPFVRTGPNEISIAHPDAIKAVLGSGGFPKGPYYDPRKDPTVAARPLDALQGDAHASRRRIWNRGMGSDSLQEYESIVANRVTQLVDRLEGLSGPVDISEWFSFFTFDFMGDMAFGGGFEMMRDGGDREGLWTIVSQGIVATSVLAHIPWLVPILQKIPKANEGIKRLQTFSVGCATRRIKSGSQVKDLWYHLTDEAGMEKEKPGFAEAVADGVLSIIAGSDTTATALSSFVCFLLLNPDIYHRVQAEVDHVYPDVDFPFDTSRHADLRLLTACLNETLRLHPPVPTNGTRRVPAGGGRVIAGRFVPAGTDIHVPPYSIHRDSRNFSPSPDKFDPDRWLRQRKADEVLNSDAFIAFSYGPANCVGKSLAWREMLMVASTIIKKFNTRFAGSRAPIGMMNSCRTSSLLRLVGPSSLR